MTTTKRFNDATNAKPVVFTSTMALAFYLLSMLLLSAIAIVYWSARTIEEVSAPMLFEALGWWITARKCHSYVLSWCTGEEPCDFEDLVEEISKPSDDLSTDHVEVASDETRQASEKVCPGLSCNSLPRPKLYAATVVQTCKNRFGTPEDTRANRLAVRKFALDIMSSHRVRPTHINQIIDVCVDMVFVPNDVEQASMALRQSLAYANRRSLGDHNQLARELMRVITGRSAKHV